MTNAKEAVKIAVENNYYALCMLRLVEEAAKDGKISTTYFFDDQDDNRQSEFAKLYSAAALLSELGFGTKIREDDEVGYGYSCRITWGNSDSVDYLMG